jgi:hypothetical protein
MQSKFLIQQSLMVIATTMAIDYNGKYDMDLVGLEFGRVAHPEQQDIADNEV